MKVDKANPRHWFRLLRFAASVMAVWLLQPWVRQGRRVRVVFYGHKLSGNLLAIHDALVAEGDIEPVFLTMDPVYAKELSGLGKKSCQAGTLSSVLLLLRAKAVISDHGLHAMSWLVGRSRLRFLDVWHGIPFKGFDADDFRLQHRYDEVWVASPLSKELYVKRYGFKPDRVHVTGYARTDLLAKPGPGKEELLEQFGLGGYQSSRFVLFAPTWKQDSRNRSLFPFGETESTFIDRLASVCRAKDAVLLVRKHLNSNGGADTPADGVVYLPFAAFPHTEAILSLSSLLICDWSSIAFDYLLLDRPTIFLETPPPFRKGFSLGPEYRFGRVVASMDSLLNAAASYLEDDENYRADVGGLPGSVRERVYNGYADGKCAQRCIARLRAQIKEG